MRAFSYYTNVVDGNKPHNDLLLLPMLCLILHITFILALQKIQLSGVTTHVHVHVHKYHSLQYYSRTEQAC